MSVGVSIVVPVYNEEESVEAVSYGIFETVEQSGLACEVIFVDDGSEDKTWEVIEDLRKRTPQLRAIKLRQNYGQTSAMVAGFDHATGQIIVTMDGDLQNDPKDIPTLIGKIEEGYDVVSGWRIKRRDHFLRVFLSKIANRLISFTTGISLHDYGCSLKAYRAECIKSLKAYGEMHRFLPALASMTGARITEVPVNHRSRRHGISKYGFDRIPKVASDILAMVMIVRFSSHPLKGFVFCCIPFVLLGLFFGALGALALILQWTPSKALFFMISAALNGMAVVHLITLGIVGELVLASSDLRDIRLHETGKRLIYPDKKTKRLRAGSKRQKTRLP